MKKIYIYITLTIIGITNSFSQNELGAFIFPQITSVHNKANRQDDPIYQAQPTLAWGAGFSFLHHMNKRVNHGPIRHGVTAASMKSKKSIRFDLLYSGHDQNFFSEFRYDSDSISTWSGKKRFDYLKLPVLYELTYPINKFLNFSLYAGPQLSFLMRAKGGIVYWEHHENFDYYDLPFSDIRYFNRFNLDAVFGTELDIKVDRWVHLVVGVRGDWSTTYLENNDRIINSYPNYGQVNGFDKKRHNSHTTSLALTLGAYYQFHHAEHKLTRY